MDNLKFKHTKTIRFVGIPEKASLLEQKVGQLNTQNGHEASLLNLVQEGTNLISDFKKFVFWNFDLKQLKKGITVHFRWLRTFTKFEYYQWKDNKNSDNEGGNEITTAVPANTKNNTQANNWIRDLHLLKARFDDNKKQSMNTGKKPEKKLLIRDVDYLGGVLHDFCVEFQYILDKLAEAYNRDTHNKSRRSEIAFLLSQLAKNENLLFLKELLYDLNDKNSAEELEHLRNKVKSFENLFDIERSNYLPAQSNGILLTKATFNYYTLNKNPNDYDNKLEELHKRLNSRINNLNNNDQSFLKRFGLNTDLGLKDLYSQIKEFKATQKSKFLEEATKDREYNELKQEFQLFTTSQANFNRLKGLTQEIVEFSKLYNNTREKEYNDKIKIKREERNKMFQGNTFKRYNKINKIYSRVAVKLGNIKAQIKGIERERIDSQLLGFWAMIGKKNEKYYLILIPKSRASEAYRSCKDQKRLDNSEDQVLYYFESFTFRALRKLCFKRYDNTFLPEVKRELPIYKEISGEHNFKNSEGELDEQALIKFYQSVLETEVFRRNLVAPHGKLADIAKKKYQSLMEFKVDLERECYQRIAIKSKQIIDQILSQPDTQVFELTSYDLKKEDCSNLKKHTTIWNDFWSEDNQSNSYKVRLNPEISIFWREARVSTDSLDSEQNDTVPRLNNRYGHSQFTVAFTITQNALSNELNYAFEGFEKQKEALKEFNRKINSAIEQKLEETNVIASFGIDTGEAELATIGLTECNKPFEIKVLKLRQDKLGFEKIGYLADGTPRDKPYKAIDNLSYFIKEDLYNKTFRDSKYKETFNELFEEIITSTLDLTCAKVICGKIILNGDLKTRQKLNYLNALRQLRQALAVDPTIQLNIDSDNKVCISQT